MANYSSSDVNEAKRRVEEMRRKSQNYISNQSSNQNARPADDALTKNDKKNENPVTDILNSLLSGSSSGDSSKAIVLALILILSKEGADNSLILALLYILL